MSLRECFSLIGLCALCVGTVGFVFHIVNATVLDEQLLLNAWPMYLLCFAGLLCYEIFHPKGK